MTYLQRLHATQARDQSRREVEAFQTLEREVQKAWVLVDEERIREFLEETLEQLREGE